MRKLTIFKLKADATDKNTYQGASKSTNTHIYLSNYVLPLSNRLNGYTNLKQDYSKVIDITIIC